LRKIWLSTNGKVRLMDTLIFTKWLNLVILDMRNDSSKDINKIKLEFGKILDEQLWKPKDPELGAISKAAFHTFAELVELPIKTLSGNSWSSPAETGGDKILITASYGTLLPPKDLKYLFELAWLDSFAKLLV